MTRQFHNAAIMEYAGGALAAGLVNQRIAEPPCPPGELIALHQLMVRNAVDRSLNSSVRLPRLSSMRSTTRNRVASCWNV